jgi:hypothetical protein
VLSTLCQYGQQYDFGNVHLDERHDTFTAEAPRTSILRHVSAEQI